MSPALAGRFSTTAPPGKPKSWALKGEWSVVGWGTLGPGREKRSYSRQNEERTVTWWYGSLKCIPGTPGGPSVAFTFSTLSCTVKEGLGGLV